MNTFTFLIEYDHFNASGSYILTTYEVIPSHELWQLPTHCYDIIAWCVSSNPHCIEELDNYGEYLTQIEYSI